MYKKNPIFTRVPQRMKNIHKLTHYYRNRKNKQEFFKVVNFIPCSLYPFHHFLDGPIKRMEKISLLVGYLEEEKIITREKVLSRWIHALNESRRGFLATEISSTSKSTLTFSFFFGTGVEPRGTLPPSYMPFLFIFYFEMGITKLQVHLRVLRDISSRFFGIFYLRQ